MSCYFRHIKDVLKEAGIMVSPQNKKQIDQAIHQIVEVQYKKCMPDCWSEVKKRLEDEKGRKTFISLLKKTVKG